MYRLFRLFTILSLFLTGLSGGRCQETSYGTSKVMPNCPLHVIIALDFSASERAFLDEVQTVLFALTNRFELHPYSMKIGLITFNRGAQKILSLTGDEGELERTIDALSIPLSVFATDIHAGIDMAYEEFKVNSTESVKKFFILISDGDPHAHSRGFGFQQDLVSMEKLKSGSSSHHIDPVHVFTLYTGENTPFADPWSEEVRLSSIRHMQKLASSAEDFFYFEQYPRLINLLEQISSCL